MSRPMYNGRTAAEWFQIWQEDTDALQRKVKDLQQKLDDAEAQLEAAADLLARVQLADPETAYD